MRRQESGHESGAVYCFTSQRVTMGTNFYLSLKFSGQYTTGCWLTFDIMDIDHLPMYHLGFRVNRPTLRNSVNKLVQSKKVDGMWLKTISLEEMNLVDGGNDIRVKVGAEFYQLWVNDVIFKEIVSVDTDRLSQYSHLVIGQKGTCASFDLERSYATFFGGKFSWTAQFFSGIIGLRFSVNIVIFLMQHCY